MSGSAYNHLLDEYLNKSIYYYFAPEEFTDENKDNDKNETEDIEIPF